MKIGANINGEKAGIGTVAHLLGARGLSHIAQLPITKNLGKIIQSPFAKSLSKGLGIASAGFGVYNAIQDYGMGDKWGAGVDIGTTALSFAGPVGIAGAVGVDYTKAKSREWYNTKSNIEQQTGLGEWLDKQREYASRSKSLGLPSQEQFRGDRESLHKFLDQNATQTADTTSIKKESSESNDNIIAKLNDINTNIMILGTLFGKGLAVNGVLKGNVGINKGDVTALITSVTAGNPTPSKIAATA
jgi:hypothetical protein